jgi:hypothetical protein
VTGGFDAGDLVGRVFSDMQSSPSSRGISRGVIKFGLVARPQGVGDAAQEDQAKK